MKKTIIISAALLAGLAAVFLIMTAAIKKDKKFKVTHFAEVTTEVGKDGRAAVGSPEVYQVRISPSLTWEKGDNNVKLWRMIGWVLLIVAAAYAGMSETGVIKGNIHYLYVALVISLASYIGAYSSAYSNNYKELSATEYNAIKDNPEALKALFDKPLIK